MKLLFKQRFLSWFDSYDIYNENGEVEYSVEGQLSWGHRLHVHDKHGHHVATLSQRVLTFLPKFDIYIQDELIGTIEKQFTFFVPAFYFPYKQWMIEGEFLEWDYEMKNSSGEVVARANKQLFNWTDTYVIDVNNKEDALYALMVVLAIDAEKCSRN